MINVFTVDLEDWFCSYENESYIKSGAIDEYLKNLVSNTKTILLLLKNSGNSATFFVLGKVAEILPDLICEIANEGHEIACHGYNHKPVSKMDEVKLTEDIELSINAIYSSCGIKPEGYRAPNFSINNSSDNLYNALKGLGFKYDSSVYPVRFHPAYGSGKKSINPFIHKSGILEIPLSCAKLFKVRIPCSGGAYFRFYPYPLFRYLFNKCNEQNGYGIFYIHPWELSNSLPVNFVHGLNKIRKYYNINKTQDKLERLLNQFKFVSISELIEKGGLDS